MSSGHLDWIYLAHARTDFYQAVYTAWERGYVRTRTLDVRTYSGRGARWWRGNKSGACAYVRIYLGENSAAQRNHTHRALNRTASSLPSHRPIPPIHTTSIDQSHTQAPTSKCAWASRQSEGQSTRIHEGPDILSAHARGLTPKRTLVGGVLCRSRLRRFVVSGVS